MATQGPNNPGTSASDTSVGSVAWVALSNMTGAPDSSYASTSSGANSYYAKLTNLGFSIPSGATINGILVEMYLYRAGFFNAYDNSIKIVKGGTISGNENASGTAYPTSYTWLSRGGASDLWGLSWTDSDINASTFGVAISCKGDSGEGKYGQTNVDAVRITIYYTAAATFIASQQRPIQQAVKRSNFY